MRCGRGQQEDTFSAGPTDPFTTSASPALQGSNNDDLVGSWLWCKPRLVEHDKEGLTVVLWWQFQPLNELVSHENLEMTIIAKTLILDFLRLQGFDMGPDPINVN